MKERQKASGAATPIRMNDELWLRAFTKALV